MSGAIALTSLARAQSPATLGEGNSKVPARKWRLRKRHLGIGIAFGMSYTLASSGDGAFAQSQILPDGTLAQPAMKPSQDIVVC